jgi:hypothetical protein
MSVRAVAQSIEAFLFIEGEVRIFLLFHRVFHRAVEMPCSSTSVRILIYSLISGAQKSEVCLTSGR